MSPQINFLIPEPLLMKLGVCIYIMAPELVSTPYFIYRAVCVPAMCMPLSLLGIVSLKLLTVATNSHATVEEMVDAVRDL